MNKNLTIGLASGATVLLAGGAIVFAAVAPPAKSSEPPAHQSQAQTAPGIGAALFDNLRNRQTIVDAVYFDQTLQESLPNQQYSVNGGEPKSVSSAVISGTVTQVSPGTAYIDHESGSSEELPYDAPNADWRALVLTVEVDHDFDTGRDIPNKIRVGLAFRGEVDEADALVGLRGSELLLVLDEPGFFPFDRSLYSIAHSGALIGTIDDAGRIAFPVLSRTESASYLGGITSVDELDKAAAQEPEVIVYENFQRVAP